MKDCMRSPNELSSLWHKLESELYFRSSIFFSCLVSCFGLLHPCLMAQETPPAPGGIHQQQQQSLDQYMTEQEKDDEREPENQVEAPEANQRRGKSTKTQKKKFWVREFDVGSSKILTPEEINGIVRPLEGRKLTQEQILSVIDKLNQLYAEKNHPTARAFLGSETIKNGVVKIRMVESTLGKFTIQGAKHLDPGYVRSCIDQEQGSVLLVPDLESELTRFNRLNDSNLRAKLAPGSAFGTTDVVLKVREPDPYQLSLFTDNAGQESVGRWRSGAFFKVANVIGRSDPLSIIANRSDGTGSYYVSYSVPLTADGLRLETSWSDSEMEVVDSPYEDLDITGDFSQVSAGLLYPFLVRSDAKWTVYGRSSRSWSESYVGGLELQDLRQDMYRGGVSASLYDESGRWTMDHSLNLGSDEEDVFYYAGTFSRWQRLTESTRLVLSCAGQYAPADRVMPSSEQFQVGGISSARGFSEGALSGNSGYFFNVEMRRPLFENPDGLLSSQASDLVEGFLFVDHGAAFPYRENDDHPDHNDYLTSAGVGTRFNISEYIIGRVACGFPLNESDRDPDPQSPYIHFSIQLQCF